LKLDMSYRCLWILMLLSLPGLLAAAETESVESIRAAVLGILGRDIEAEINLDPALRMPPCGVPLHASHSGHTTVEVKCPQAGWRLFVPVRIRRHQPVLVLTRGIAAGDTIRADMLTQEIHDTRRIVGTPLSDPASAIGQTARRALAAGSVLASGHLRAPESIHRGDQVTLVSRQGGVEVRMSGRALSAGGTGERINVENLSSRRRVQGLVMDDGDVQVVR